MAYDNESGLRQVAMLTPSEQARDGDPDEDRRSLLAAIGQAGDPRIRATLQYEFNRRFNGGPSAPPVTSMRDGFPELRGGMPDSGPQSAPSTPMMDAARRAIGGTAPAQGSSITDRARALLAEPDPVPRNPDGLTRTGDILRSVKTGIEQLPGQLAGLADIVPALAFNARPFTKAADAIGNATGFKPGQWAKDTKFSPGYEDSAKSVEEAWKPSEAVLADQNASKLDYAKAIIQSTPALLAAYGSNPLYTLNQVANSLPGILAGGAASKGMMVAGRVAGVAGDAAANVAARAPVAGYLARAVGEKAAAPIAAGAGEGMQQSGSQMEQYQGSDQRKNALAALGSGTTDAVLSALGGRIANHLGLETAGTALAKAGDDTQAVSALSTGKRIAAGAAMESPVETAQSVTEQNFQNWADNKPLMEGALRQGVEGGLAGGVMGAGANVKNGHSHAEESPLASPSAPTVGVPPAVVAQATGTPVAPLTTAGDLIRQDKQPGTGPLTNALNAGVEDAAQKADAALPPPELDTPHAPRPLTADQLAAIRGLPPEQQEDAVKLGQLGNDPTVVPGVRRHAQAKLDALLGDQTPLNPIVDDPKTGEPVLPAAPTVAAPKPGNENDQALARAESDLRRSDADAAAQREADRPPLPTGEVQDGDILNRIGKPFTTIAGAMRAQSDAGVGHEIVRVARGLVVRKTKTDAKESNGPARTADAGRDSSGDAPVAAAPGGAGALVSEQPASAEAARPVADVGAGTVAADPAVRPAGDEPAVGQPPHIGGEHLADGFHAFTPESGTLGVPRAEMPQVKAAHRGALVNFLGARGITHESVEVPSESLKPTQAEFSPEKVIKAMGFTDTDRSILVSSDNHVVDGHHQWMAKREAGLPITAIRLNAPIADLLPLVREFPSSTAADGATQASPNTDEQIPSAGARAEEQAAPAQAAPAEPAPAATAAPEPAGLPASGRADVQADGLTPGAPVAPSEGVSAAPAPAPAPKFPNARTRAIAKKAEQAAQPVKPLDHGELNIPGRTNSIDRELDKFKAEQATKQKATARATSAQTRADKAEAKLLAAEHTAGLVAHTAPGIAQRQGVNGKQAERQVAHAVGQMVKWEPRKAIDLFNKYLQETAEQRESAAAETSVGEKAATAPSGPRFPNVVTRAREAKAAAEREALRPTPQAADAPSGKSEEADAAPAFSRPSGDEITPEQHALKALSENDDLFRLKKSTADTVAGIAADVDPGIKVKQHLRVGIRNDYTLTMPDGNTARMTVRDPNPYGPNVYGFKTVEGEARDMQTERPGENPEDVPEKGDVWIDVSLLKPGGDGGKVYAIAANFAHNTGRIFIGDPAGLSNDAMVRRPEQMLSSALKFGTTEHLAPHPRQVAGDREIGVPPLKWIYGDDIGNIRRLIDLNLAVQQNLGDGAITFDPGTGQFLDSAGDVLDREGIEVLAVGAGLGRALRAGGSTLARSAVLRSLARQESGEARGLDGRSDGLLAKLAKLGRDAPKATRELFYSRSGTVDPAKHGAPALVRNRIAAAGSAAQDGLGTNRAEQGEVAGESPRAPTVAEEDQAFAERVAADWENKPSIKVVNNIDDPSVPQAVRDEDSKQRSLGAAGDPEGVFHDGTVYLFSDQLRGEADIRRVLMHEALGHYGLRGVFGKELGGVLDRLAVARPADLKAKAEKYGFDLSKPKERRAAAEEVLAELAETNPELGWVRQAVAAIRTWLREHMPGYKSMRMSDEEVIRNYILPARAWVQNASKTTVSRAAFAETQPAVRALSEANDASPRFSRTIKGVMNDAAEVKMPFGYVVGDLFSGDGKISWWHKTLGSMFNLAERSPEFKRVYDATQNFLNDTSRFANEAADLAPKMLPKLDGWRDLAKSPISPEDTKALRAPVFEGTLLWTRDADGKPVKLADREAAAAAMTPEEKGQALFRAGKVSEAELKRWKATPLDIHDGAVNNRYADTYLKAGIVWTDDELRSIFKATPGQIGLYHETRNSLDRSIGDLATSEMIRLGGKDLSPELQAQALGLKDADKAAMLLRDALYKRANETPDRADVLNDAAEKIVQIADHAKGLQERGYAPLSRHGEYSLDVIAPDGERAYFGMFESAAERSKMARQMVQNYPGATVKQGTVSQEEYKLFAGVSPETVELFGELLGLDSTGENASDRAFQQAIKLSTSNRSAMRRLLHRKGIAGFSEDAGRVLAGFVVSNARRTSSNLHMGNLDKAVTEIDKSNGQLKDVAVKLRDYVTNPVEEAQAIKGLLFAQYLGGSVASAVVNATQPFTVTMPWLSQFGGIAQAGKQMAAAVVDARKRSTGDRALDTALKEASEQGVVSPQEIHNLMGQAAGKAQLRSGDGTAFGNATATARNTYAKFQLAWGKVFSVAEQFNRRVTFIASYRTAVAQRMEDPAGFAARAVAETQFTYNKGNKPTWARGAIGGTIFTFKQYSINYLELLHRMWNAGEPGSPERASGRKATLFALATLFLIGGADGLPFADDADDLIDGFMQRLGYNFASKRARREFFAKILGEDGGRFIDKGLSGLPGVPIDVSGRMGMGNLLPGTGLFMKKADHTSDIQELAGPIGDFGKRALQAGDKLLDGDIAGAATVMQATAMRNIYKGIDMLNTGEYRDNKGRKIIDVSAVEAAFKMLGFQPNSVAQVQDAAGEVMQMVSLTKLVQSELGDKMAQAVYANDAEAKHDVLALRDRWNAANADMPVKLNMAGVAKRVREMRMSKADRIAATSPKSMRQQVRGELATN